MRGDAIEPVEPQRVREQARNAAGEAVELRERVLAQRDEDVDAVGGGEQCRQRLCERARAPVVSVVQEVLLGLVEDEVDVSLCLRALERLQRPAVRAGSVGLADRLRQGRGRILAPAREHDDERRFGELPERPRDGCAQQRRLPHAARPVEDGQPRGDEVGDDDLTLALAPEEEEGVELRVVEGVEPLVRRSRQGAHAVSSRRARSSK